MACDGSLPAVTPVVEGSEDEAEEHERRAPAPTSAAAQAEAILSSGDEELDKHTIVRKARHG